LTDLCGSGLPQNDFKNTLVEIRDEAGRQFRDPDVVLARTNKAGLASEWQFTRLSLIGFERWAKYTPTPHIPLPEVHPQNTTNW